jgi:hypothetical protein
MVTLEPISIQELSPLVALAFRDDKDLLERYHVSPGELDHCVEHTMRFIEGNHDHFKDRMEIYRVLKHDETIGFTVLIRHHNGFDELYSFGINIASRKNYVLLPWLEAVKKKINCNFYIVLWAKNSRAIKFFERNSFNVLRNSKYLNDDTKTLILCRQEE